MATPIGLDTFQLYQYIKNLRVNINVKTRFSEQVKQIDFLLSNDKTGLVSTIVDFMVHSATVPMRIETKNETLNTFLQTWQKRVLNRNVNIDIPGGLRELSAQNYRERWRSSLLALKVIWGKEQIANQGNFIVPKKMWFLNGGAVETEANGALNTRKFYLKLKGEEKIQLTNTKSESIFIRKPYTSWHEDKVTPYLTKRGTVFNALMKNAIVQKQSDVIEAILPLLLQIKAGSDKLAVEGAMPTEEEFKKLKDGLVSAADKFEAGGNFGDIIAALRHDVNLDYLIPDLTKIFDDKIVKSTDRNLLSSLGMIELKGFSTTREEAILNPKVMVEEVTDAVLDWANLLEDVMIEMIERNKDQFPKLTNNEIRVIPGNIKAFITDEMRSMLRSLYDRGVISKQTEVEEATGLDFEVEVERREKETNRDLDKKLKPPIIQNLEQYDEPTNLEDQNKKPGTPESENFNNAILKYFAKHKGSKRIVGSVEDVINTPEGLPEDIKKLSEAEQFVYWLTYNYSVDCNNKTADEGHKIARDSIGLNATAPLKEKTPLVEPYETIDDLPKNVSNVLSVPAKLIWLRVFNSVLEETQDEEGATQGAWSQVSEKYEKLPNKKKWVKKAQIEDYESEMSPYTYKYFKDIYDTAITNESSTQNALKTALTIVERVCTKNKDGILVKDKTISKKQMQSLEGSNFVEKILDLEIKDKKLKLLDKLLKEDE